MFFDILSADNTSTVPSNLTSLLIPGIISVIVVFVTNYFTHRDKKDASNTDIYKVQLEQITKQREQVTVENDKLRDDLKEELEDCRQLRHTMEIQLEELKRKINTIEAELFAWRNGFKTPGGYLLVKIADDHSPTALSQTDKKIPTSEEQGQEEEEQGQEDGKD